MGSADKSLASSDYDNYLARKAGDSRSARQELAQRHSDRRNAHDGEGKGWHFGLGNEPVKANSKEEFKHELNKRGLMLATDVRKDLRGPGKHEFSRRTR